MDQALRPMSTAQVLDRTFFLYRSNFVLFAGIASIPPAFLLVAQMIGFAIPKPANNLPGLPSGIAAITAGVIVGIGILLYLVGYSLATGASIYAVSNAHLGKTTTISQSYRSVSNRVGAIIATSICAGLVVFAVTAVGILMGFALAKVMGPSSAFILIPGGAIGIVFLIRLILRYSIATQACVLEKLGPVQSIKRSFSLAKGSEGRIFLIILLNAIVVTALTLVFSIPTFLGLGLAATKGSQPPLQYQIMQALASFIASTLSGPISIIAFSLVYYDQRVRKEAFDLTLMMEAIGQAPPQAAAASAGTPASIG